MSKTNAEQYQAIQYPDFIHTFTHPAALGAISHLYGLNPAKPNGARILDVGTHRGGNLQWIASGLPDAQCLGVDLIESSISHAKKSAREVGLNNLEYLAADLLDCDFGDQQFDYIIAHGFFSWVPQEVSQRLFEICKQHLAPKGVALISYNAMPGSAARDALRQLLLLEPVDVNNLEKSGRDALDHVLRHLEGAISGMDDLPHFPMLNHHIKAMRECPFESAMLDEMGAINEPYYLLQFTQWAAENGLAYVADSMLGLDWIDIHPRSMKQAVVDSKMPRLKALQYADYLFNTMFRRSIICRSEDAADLRATPDLAKIENLYVSSRLRPEGVIAITKNHPIQYRVLDEISDSQGTTIMKEHEKVFLVKGAATQMVLNTLAQAKGQPISMRKVWADTREKLRIPDDHEKVAFKEVGTFILKAVCKEQMAIYTHPIREK